MENIKTIRMMEHTSEVTNLHRKQVQNVLGWRAFTQTIKSSFWHCTGLPKNHSVCLRVLFQHFLNNRQAQHLDLGAVKALSQLYKYQLRELGLLSPEKRTLQGASIAPFSTQRGFTRRLEGDFTQGHVVIGQSLRWRTTGLN